MCLCNVKFEKDFNVALECSNKKCSFFLLLIKVFVPKKKKKIKY